MTYSSCSFKYPCGVTAYFILKNEDPSKTKNHLWLGIPLSVFYAAYIVFSIMVVTFQFS